MNLTNAERRSLQALARRRAGAEASYRAKIEQLVQQGVSVAQLAQALGISRQSLWQSVAAWRKKA